MQMSLLRLTPIAAALALTACATAAPTGLATAPTSLDTWASSVQVTPVPEEIRLATHPTGLSGNQARALSEFHSRWMQAEGGIIVISAPNAGGYRVGNDAREFLLSQGARSDQVRLQGYDSPARDAPVVVGFQRFTVTTPNCGAWGNLSSTFANEPQGNFGCAVTANMAAQVANPQDLIGSRPMDPADPGRRATVMDKYRKGETTSSVKDTQASGTVSQAIQ